MAEIRKIQPVPDEPARKKRVAAYARVSMESDNLLNSLSNQISSYSTLIQSRSDWEYAGVYSDRGITGTSTAHRDEFNRMIKECEAGKIDLVLTKSISRFARNTVDLLETVRHLKEIGVEVYFEEQRISSMTCDGEMMLTLLGAFAQEEAETIKDNVEWGIRKRFEQGIPNGSKRFLGYEWNGEEYVIIPEEAEIIRRIFCMYLNGKSTVQIAKALNKDGATNINGGPISQNNICFILDNENYTGNLLLQKRYSPSIGKRAANRGQVPMYRVEEAHEPIIDMDTFERVQTLRKERAAQLPEKEVTCFSGLLKCGYCGHSVCRRNKSNYKTNTTWICNAVDKKGITACACSRRLPETELIEAVKDILGDNYEAAIRREVKEIIVYDDRLEFHMADRVKVWPRHFPSDPHGPHGRGCFSRKVYCGKCGSLFVRRARKGKTVWMCKNRHKDCTNSTVPESELYQAVESLFGKSATVGKPAAVSKPDDLEMQFYCQTDKVFVFDDRLEFQMKNVTENGTENGRVRTWQRK